MDPRVGEYPNTLALIPIRTRWSEVSVDEDVWKEMGMLDSTTVKVHCGRKPF